MQWGCQWVRPVTQSCCVEVWRILAHFQWLLKVSAVFSLSNSIRHVHSNFICILSPKYDFTFLFATLIAWSSNKPSNFRILVLLACSALLKLHEPVIRKLDILRGGLTRCHGVLDHGLNFHRNIPFDPTVVLLKDEHSHVLMSPGEATGCRSSLIKPWCLLVPPATDARRLTKMWFGLSRDKTAWFNSNVFLWRAGDVRSLFDETQFISWHVFCFSHGKVSSREIAD